MYLKNKQCYKKCEFCFKENWCKECKNDKFVVHCSLNEKGQHHSKYDNPAISYSDGRLEWYKDGKFHREDGPAEIYWCNSVDHNKYGIDWEEEWYLNGKEALILYGCSYIGKLKEEELITIRYKQNQNDDVLGNYLLLEKKQKYIWKVLRGDEQLFIDVRGLSKSNL